MLSLTFILGPISTSSFLSLPHTSQVPTQQFFLFLIQFLTNFLEMGLSSCSCSCFPFSLSLSLSLVTQTLNAQRRTRIQELTYTLYTHTYTPKCVYTMKEMFTVKLTVSLSLYLSHTNTNTHGSSVVFGRFLPLSLTHLSCPTLSLVYYEQNSASFCLRLSFSQYINKYSTKFTRNKYKKVEGVLGVRTRDSWMIGANLFNELWQYLPLFLSHTHSHSRN